jgi:hypothetical protein
MTQSVRRILAAEVRVARLCVFIEMGPIAMLAELPRNHGSFTPLPHGTAPAQACSNPRQAGQEILRLFAGSLLRI